MVIVNLINFDSLTRHYGQYKLVDFMVRESGEKFLAKRVRLRNSILSRLIPNFLRRRVMSNNLIKKSVRVDYEMYNLLFRIARGNKKFLTNIINSAVIEKFSTREIDLIDARLFKKKITVYFTQKEYRQVQDVLDELKDRKIKGVTFSSLVRSILYKSLGIVMEAPDYAENKLNESPQANIGKSVGATTNPINHSSNEKQKKHTIGTRVR